jgi:uncharacterized YigZ family protein
MEDEYVTLGGAADAELRVKGSRFLAVALPVHRKDAAEAAVKDVARRHHDATHTCYAFRLADGDCWRAHDGGEPAGTAGRPILAAIDRAGVTDALVVVARWFGGVKLGAGGLARAYSDAAALALVHAPHESRFRVEVVEAVFPHARTGDVMHAVSRSGARIRETTYDDEVHLTLEVRQSKLELLSAELVERTAGNIRFVRKGVTVGQPGAEDSR